MRSDFLMLTICIPVGEEGPNENAKVVGRRKARFAKQGLPFPGVLLETGRKGSQRPALVLGLCLIATHWLHHMPVWFLCGTDAKVGLERQAFV